MLDVPYKTCAVIACVSALMACSGIDSALAGQTIDLPLNKAASTPRPPLPPSNPNANAATKAEYNWLQNLPNRSDKRIVSGLFGGWSESGASGNDVNAFGTVPVTQLRAMTGQYPGLFGCDYYNPKIIAIDTSCNAVLKSFWKNGSLITINVHFPNPSNGGPDKSPPLSNFSDLLNNTTPTGAEWQRYLDSVAAGLEDLQNAGVTVLFRPLLEMNGNWFWWGSRDPETFKKVWISMYNYLTVTKKLNNLLWIYSPAGPDATSGDETLYYPGAPYVDIVGIDAYNDIPSNEGGYAELIALNKPFAMSEIGPRSFGSFDYGTWIAAIKQKFPAAIYFLAWNGKWSPVENANASGLMNDPWVINQGGVNFSNVTPRIGGSSD